MRSREHQRKLHGDICKAKGGCTSCRVKLNYTSFALPLGTVGVKSLHWFNNWVDSCMEDTFWKAVLCKLLRLLITGDLGGWGYIMEQCHCMHLKTAPIKRTDSSSSFFFFILFTDHMLCISKGVLPEKQDYSHLQEWSFVVYQWFCASVHTAA